MYFSGKNGNKKILRTGRETFFLSGTLSAVTNDRSNVCLHYRYASLREVPAYPRFIQERFERCLDLYLCPRQRRMKVSSN